METKKYRQGVRVSSGAVFFKEYAKTELAKKLAEQMINDLDIEMDTLSDGSLLFTCTVEVIVKEDD